MDNQGHHLKDVSAAVRGWVDTEFKVSSAEEDRTAAGSRFIFWLPDHGRVFDVSREAMLQIDLRRDIEPLMQEIRVADELRALPSDWRLLLRTGPSGSYELVSEPIIRDP